MDWGSYIVSIAKSDFKKIGALICSMKFLSPEGALYHYKSTIIWPCIEYCCHVWTGAHSFFLELLDKLQKWICRTVGPSLAASLEPLIFLSPFVDVTRMSMSTVFFLAQLDCGLLTVSFF